MRRACVLIILRNQEEEFLAWATRYKIMFNFPRQGNEETFSLTNSSENRFKCQS